MVTIGAMVDGMVGAFGGLFRGRRRGAELARVDAEITAFGEALARHSFVPGPEQGEQVLADYQLALDAYERAKRDFVGDRNLRDAADVLRALDAGRHALACVDAVREGRPRPERRPLCFFDPRHGTSTEEVDWAPPEGAVRTIAVCAADAVRLSEGLAPIDTGSRKRGVGRRRPGAGAPEVGVGSGRGSGKSAVAPVVSEAVDAYAAWPPRTGARQRWESRGATGIQLLRAARRAPALLVVRLDRAEGSWVELDGPPGAGRRPLLTHGSVLTRAVVPLPADGQDRIRLRVHTKGGWRAWLHPLRDVPALGAGVRSSGGYVLRHPGGRMPLRVTQDGGGHFSLRALRADLTPGATLLEGEGSFDATATAPRKPGLLYVESRASWSIAPA